MKDIVSYYSFNFLKQEHNTGIRTIVPSPSKEPMLLLPRRDRKELSIATQEVGCSPTREES